MQDSLTIGIILFLLIAALGVYIWLRFQQVETRLSLAESILLDMKMVTQTYSQFPSMSEDVASDGPSSSAPASETRNVTYNAPTNSAASSSVPIVNITKMDEVEPLSGLMGMDAPDGGAETFPSMLDEIRKEMNNAAEETSSDDLVVHQATSSFSGPTDYNGMTLKDLRSLAKSRGISGTGSMNRGQLIAILQEKETSAMEIEFDVANETQE
jgi:hypothetical protein